MRRLFQIAIGLIFAPIWIPLAAIVMLALFVMCVPVCFSGFLAHRRWKRALQVAGRTQSPEAVLHRTNSGTLIVDRPALGWNTTYCWWTPDDIESLSPIPIPTDKDRRDTIKSGNDGKLSHPFDVWVYERYLALETGTALLLSTRRGDKLATKLLSLLPTHKMVTSWSGPCEMEFGAQDTRDAA